MSNRTREDAARDPASLGTPIAVYQPARGTRVVIAACGAVCVGCGLFVGRYPGQIVFSSLVAGWGVVLLILAYLMGTYRLLICSGGVIVRIRGQVKDRCPWSEIREIVDGSVGTRIGSSRRCSLVKRDGSRVDLVDVNVGQYGSMVATLRQSSGPHGISWKEEIVKPDRVDWMRCVSYGVIGFTVLLLIFAGVMLLSVK